MNVVVAGTPQSRYEWVLSAMEQADGITTVGVDLADAKEQGADAERFLFLYSRPEYALEQAVREGADASEAAVAWREAAEGLIALWRGNRDRTLVLDGPSASEQANAFARACKQHLGVGITLEGQQGEGEDTGKALERVIAAQCVAASVELSDLAGELEAIAVPLSQMPPAYEPDCGQAQGEYRDLLEKAGQASGEEKKELEEENELLLLQLHQVQEELESYYLEAKELRDRHGSANTAEVEELKQYALTLEKDILKLLRSRTWKVMAPVREVGRLMKSVIRRKRVPRNRLPERPALLGERKPS